MVNLIDNQVVLGTYKGVDFHYIFNQNKAFMINASEVANFLKIDISEYLNKETTKYYINSLLNYDIDCYDKTVSGYERVKGKKNTLEDLLLIENGTYFFDYFLIYEITKEHLSFYFWIDHIRIDTIRGLLNVK
jgi:hypothetical protein